MGQLHGKQLKNDSLSLNKLDGSGLVAIDAGATMSFSSGAVLRTATENILVDTDVINVEYLDSVLLLELTEVDASLDSLEDALSAEISSTNSDVIALQNSVDSLELLIGNDVVTEDDFKVESFAGTPNLGPYTLATAVALNEAALVAAFVNGLHVSVASVSGTSVTLSDPGYTIAEEDTVVFRYVVD